MRRNPLAAIGALLADDTRAELLTALMDGRAHTGGELARQLGVSASTVSEHLRKLVDAGVLVVAAQGRHRYFQLADHQIAELLESLGATALSMPPPRAPAALSFVRTCYDHLAGELAVRIYDQLHHDGHLTAQDDHLRLTESGTALLREVGVVLTPGPGRPLARSCLDWTQRRRHLAGRAGAGLLDALLASRWLARQHNARSLRVTRAGRAGITEAFGVQL